MKHTVRILGLVVFIALFYSLVYAGSRFQHLVDAAWLAGQKGKVTVDVSDRDIYLQGHIAGAINIPVNDLQSKPDAILLPLLQVEKILGEKGLDRDTDVVLYGAGKEVAYLEFWMLDYLGMRKLHVLDGGIEQWEGETSTVETTLPPAVFRAKPKPQVYATTDYVRHALRKPDKVLLDVRTPGEYKGTDVRSLRGGHIPGAINIHFEENFTEGSTALKSPEELAKLYAKLDKKKEIIVYCQTGTRAANTFFVLKELGFQKVRNYDASWVEWGTRLELPADDVSYFNFVPLLKKVNELEKEIQRH